MSHNLEWLQIVIFNFNQPDKNWIDKKEKWLYFASNSKSNGMCMTHTKDLISKGQKSVVGWKHPFFSFKSRFQDGNLPSFFSFKRRFQDGSIPFFFFKSRFQDEKNPLFVLFWVSLVKKNIQHMGPQVGKRVWILLGFPFCSEKNGPLPSFLFSLFLRLFSLLLGFLSSFLPNVTCTS